MGKINVNRRGFQQQILNFRQNRTQEHAYFQQMQTSAVMSAQRFSAQHQYLHYQSRMFTPVSSLQQWLLLHIHFFTTEFSRLHSTKILQRQPAHIHLFITLHLR